MDVYGSGLLPSTSKRPVGFGPSLKKLSLIIFIVISYRSYTAKYYPSEFDSMSLVVFIRFFLLLIYITIEYHRFYTYKYNLRRTKQRQLQYGGARRRGGLASRRGRRRRSRGRAVRRDAAVPTDALTTASSLPLSPGPSRLH